MTVTFFGRVTQYTNGEKSYSPDNHQTLQGLISELGEHYGEEFLSFVHGDEKCIILVNSKGITLSGGLDTALKPDDKIEILPFVDAG